jgi:LmbE family N-acetylglucosaminyl deacetylase
VNLYRKFVSEHARLFQSGKKLPTGCPPKFPRHPQVPENAPKVLIFSPHPDDECIVGGLALRLLREAKWNVINVAVTLGGNPARRPERFGELLNACCLLDFDLILAGLEHINPAGRQKRRAGWNASVKTMAKFLLRHRPRAIFLPHENDGHPTHMGTHLLVLEALETLPAGFKCHVVETEFWGQMTDPNLLVESSVEDVGDLVAALACHAGEIRRNPYHARLPAWMMDNVRRGAELVSGPSPRRSGFVHAGGPGGSAPDFTFATIYRLRQWTRGRLTNVLKRGKYLPASKNAAGIFS